MACEKGESGTEGKITQQKKTNHAKTQRLYKTWAMEKMARSRMISRGKWWKIQQ